jgi:hypothetical protein
MATMHMAAMTDAITGAREDSILDGKPTLQFYPFMHAEMRMPRAGGAEF